MENEADAIRTQMEDTRASLSEKLETLEQQIVDTVQGATTAVTDTVASVKDAVTDTVSEVKATVSETVDTVKSTFDIEQQVRKHPWLVFAGAIAAGFVAERILDHMLKPRFAASPYPPLPTPPMPVTQPEPSPIHGGNGHSLAGNGHLRTEAVSDPTKAHNRVTPQGQAHQASDLTDLFGKEIEQLKKVAIGTTMGLVRDLVTDAMPAPVREDVRHILDSVTTKLGGEPVEAGQFRTT
jgi:hypothetical protein